jgi:hypothetical protein
MRAAPLLAAAPFRLFGSTDVSIRFRPLYPRGQQPYIVSSSGAAVRQSKFI